MQQTAAEKQDVIALKLFKRRDVHFKIAESLFGLATCIACLCFHRLGWTLGTFIGLASFPIGIIFLMLYLMQPQNFPRLLLEVVICGIFSLLSAVDASVTLFAMRNYYFQLHGQTIWFYVMVVLEYLLALTYGVDFFLKLIL